MEAMQPATLEQMGNFLTSLRGICFGHDALAQNQGLIFST